jgi:hypothetical protein
VADQFSPQLASVALQEADGFEARQKLFEGFTDDQRQAALEATPLATREAWAKEELEHFKGTLQPDSPVEGAEVGEKVEEVQVDGAPEPQDRAPDVGDALIAQLVKERFDAEQRANELAARLERYKARFGELA